MTCRLDDLTNDDSRGVHASLAFLMSALGQKRTSSTDQRLCLLTPRKRTCSAAAIDVR